ncbi:hypothetical protein B0A49_04591 [Cryomyces minteri]|uniref:Uncharacterized protein n=1 Tax=Cryomyces minteri TaxID=331657 RepID=A0A4U0X866_9PEZI|nr:hypothetical protein B0A49_04591 [Cryomyces minteri]
MGGLVFSQPGSDGEPALKTPRMSPEVYRKLKAKYLKLFEAIYAIVIVAPEAVGKTDYGDVDFLVEGPRSDQRPAETAEGLGAKRFFHNSESVSFAVPLPSEQNIVGNAEKAYAQIDVRICQPGTIRWQCFLQSYGDLWQILGVVNRHVGLTANDRGLHVRLAELESTDWRGSLVFLTDDPTATMAFLGLDAVAYETGFKTEEEAFAWIRSSRFFSKAVFEQRQEKSDDRRRVKTRGMYRRFVEEFIPCQPGVDSSELVMSRGEVLSAALTTFSKQEEYKRMTDTYRAALAEKTLFEKIAYTIPLTDDKLNLVLRGMKRWVFFDHGRPCLRNEAELDDNKQPVWSQALSPDGEDEVLRWVKDNWLEVKSREQGRVNKAKSARKRERENQERADRERKEKKGRSRDEEDEERVMPWNRTVTSQCG